MWGINNGAAVTLASSLHRPRSPEGGPQTRQGLPSVQLWHPQRRAQPPTWVWMATLSSSVWVFQGRGPPRAPTALTLDTGTSSEQTQPP